MDSSEETTYFVDRVEVVLNPSPASQINADKLPILELAVGEVDVNTNAREVQSSGSLEQHVKTLGRFERSEVNVEIQGLRETTLSTTETVVNSRVRTVYSRSLSGSTSSTELEHPESPVDSLQEPEHPVFGENAYLDGEHRERKTSDSYYISQTYQINTEDASATPMTTVKCVNFKSSKDFELGSRENVGEETGLQFVDRVEEIIAGDNPEAVGSPKGKQVRFLWYDNEPEDIEAQRRAQSARENVQSLIEITYMVSDITDVVNDNYMGPESKQLKPATSDGRQAEEQLAEGGSALFIEPGRETADRSLSLASVETRDLDLLSGAARVTIEGAYANDTAHVTSSKSLASSEVTLALNTSYSAAGDSHQVTAASVVKPTDFPREFEPANSLSTERSALALAYSPGMAIRSYALEELEEKRCRVTPDRTEVEAKYTLRFDEESSGVDVDKGSSVDAVSSLTAQSTAELSITSVELYGADSLSSQRFAVATGKAAVQEMSREEEDESLDKLVDLDSIQVGYRFHDVGIMQEYGGICNLAFDDSDEQETLSSSEDRTSSLQSQSAVNMGMLVSAAASSGSSQVLSRSQLVTDKNSVTSDTRGFQSSVEYTTSFLPETAGSSIISQTTSSHFASIQPSSASVIPPFITEGITSTSEFNQVEIRTSNTSYSTQVEQTRTTFQTKESEEDDKEDLDAAVSATHEVGQKPVESVDDTDFVIKELESVIEAGEKAIQKLSASLEREDIENSNSQDNLQELKEAEDISSRKDAESVQSLQTGEYHSGYTRVEGRSHVNLYPASESVLQGKTADGSGEEAEDISSRKDAESVQSLQTGEYQSGYTWVEGRSHVNLYPASESLLQGKTADGYGEEVEAGTEDGVARASAVVGDDHTVENVEEIDANGNSPKLGVYSESESTGRIMRGDHAEHTIVTNSAAFAMESGSTSYRQQIHRAEVSTSRQANEVSGTGRASDVNQVNKSVPLDVSDSGAGLHKVDNVALITEAKGTNRVVKVDHQESNRKYATAGSTRRDINAAASSKDAISARLVGTEDINKVVEVVSPTVTNDSAVYISGVSSKTQHAVQTHPASDASAHGGHNQDEDQWNQSNALCEPDQKGQLGQTETEFVERIIQASVASEQAYAQSNVGVAVTKSNAGKHVKSDTARIKETSRSKKASKSKVTSRIEETSRIKETTIQKVVALQKKIPKQPAFVTRKFNVSSQFEASLRAQGANLKSESISIAVYYDTAEFTLTLSDSWLRSVNSKWQFHAGFTKLLNDPTKHHYSESEDKAAIMSSLAALLKCPLPTDPNSSVAMFVQKSGLREFVRYTTVHKTYSWRGMIIQLELPEYGFWVGTVTVPASCKATLHEAISIIDAFWKTTGVESLNLLLA